MSNWNLNECPDCGDMIDGTWCDACNLTAHDSEFECTECGQTLSGIEKAFCDDCGIEVGMPFVKVCS